MNVNIDEPQKRYRDQKWRIKNNVATCLNENCVGALRTLDITNDDDLTVCSLIIKNMYENKNQFYKLILKVTPALMEIIFKEKYYFFVNANPELSKVKITQYFLANSNNWFIFVEEVKKLAAGESISALGGLTLHIGAIDEFPEFEIVDQVDADNNFYLMVLACYYQVPVFLKSHIIEDELDFVHNYIGLSYLKDSNEEKLLLFRNSYSNLLNRYGYFIGLTNKNDDSSVITIYSWVKPFDINLKMLSDVADFESDMCDVCLITLKEAQTIYTNILSRSFYSEDKNMPVDAYLHANNYRYTKSRKRYVDVFISKLQERVNEVAETWYVPKDEIMLDSIISSFPWAMQIEMLTNFTERQTQLIWKYYMECNQLENGVDFSRSSFNQTPPNLESIFGFLKDLRNICAHSGILMQSLILPSATQGVLNLDMHENITLSNHRLKIKDLIEFRKILGESKELIKIFKKYHLNTEWIYKDVTDSSWPTLVNYILLLPFFVTRDVFNKCCKALWFMIKHLYCKVYHYPRNPNLEIKNWKQICLTYTKNICSYLGIDILIDEQYILEHDWD